MARSRQDRKRRQRRKLTESAAVVDATTLVETRTGALGESLGVTPTGGQKREIVVIEAGWGSSGYYPREVLARDCASIYPVGTHMYLNHPTESEDYERPERDVRDLAAVTTSECRMRGNEVVAECEVFEHYAPLIDNIAPHIGCSIRAMGEAEQGEADGRKGPIIRSLDEGISVDFVTRAGAGGKVGAKLLENARGVAGTKLEEARNAGQWLEASIHREFTLTADSMFGNGYVSREERIAISAAIGAALDSFTAALEDSAPGLYKRDPYADPQTGVDVSESKADELRENQQHKEDEMSDADKDQLAALTESVKKLEGKVTESETRATEAEKRADRAEEALARTRAAKVVAEAKHTPEGASEPVSIYKGLPEGAVKRVTESALSGDLPKTEDGKLNEDHLVERARTAAKEERDYLASAGVSLGGGPAQVVGFGESTGGGLGLPDANKADDAATAALEESFKAQGMSDNAAKLAAGRR